MTNFLTMTLVIYQWNCYLLFIFVTNMTKTAAFVTNLPTNVTIY